MRSLLPFSVLSVAALAVSAPAHASKFVFPYHHPDLEWFTIEGEHFYVHYPVSRKSKEDGNDHWLTAEFMARKSAKVADEMWEPMCEEFNYYLTEKVHIVLLNQSDDLEGFTIPAWNWIEISGNPGGYFYRMRGRMEWFSDVLVHEFAHVVSLKRNAAIGEGVGGISIGALVSDGINDHDSGGEITIGEGDPFWWTEGGAEYWSDNTGYNWWTAARDANLRTTVLENRLLTFDEWVTRVDKSDWGDGERGYQQGYSFALYLRERFGNDTYTRFAQESSSGWRLNWDSVVEDVTGVPAETLYNDWVAYLKHKYSAVHAGVKAEGEVVGTELESESGAWVARTPDQRDEWQHQPKIKKKYRKLPEAEDKKESTGTWDFYPKYSDDGRWVGEHTGRGFSFVRYPESLVPGVAGVDDPSVPSDVMREAGDTAVRVFLSGSNFGHAYDFVPGQDAVVVTGTEDMMKNFRRRWLRVEVDGYDWNKLYVVKLEPTKTAKRKHRGGKEEYGTMDSYNTLHRARVAEKFVEVPNTERGADPAVSPDGKQVAYFEYSDGTVNLVRINLDGSGKTYLTRFNDGSWLQTADWSPDGKRLVFSMIRNFRQDLYVVDADGNNLRALNRDTWEDQDAFWGKDGNIYFSSDMTGIFNIFRYNPESGRVIQLTNVIGGAECPWITPEGNLLYTGFTAHGWKNFILSKDEFFGKDVTEGFNFTPDEAEVKADLAFVEDLSYWAEKTTKYKRPRFMSPTAVPIIRFQNDSMTNYGLMAGAQFYAQDFVENHVLAGTALLGEDSQYQVYYSYQGWHPSLGIALSRRSIKNDFGFKIDADDNAATSDDQTVYDGKQAVSINVGQAMLSYPFNAELQGMLYGFGYQYQLKGTSDAKFQPFIQGYSAGVALNYSNVYGSAYSPNPRGGRAINFAYTHGGSDFVYNGYNGFDTDDGQLIDQYQYNKVEARWTEQLPVPTFGADFLQPLADKRHTIEIDTQFGYIDRNVHFFDEFRGGGQHPYFMGANAIQPNNQFAGYPGFSLAGETMITGTLSYRFPVARQINKKFGPLYIYSIYGQFGGTAGNFWSYRAPDESEVGTYYYDGAGQRVAYDPADVRREIPFRDKAYKNGNTLLTDANAELRVSAAMFGGYWNSFVRLAYGFNEVGGIGDVDGDNIQDTRETGLGNALSGETEQPGPRLYIGFGTGW
jgi:hypothetical protein